MPVLKLNDKHLFKIPIRELCYDGYWAKQINGTKILLEHLTDGIALTVDGFRHPIRWRVHEQTLHLRPRNGGFCPADRRWQYYVYGNDGRRYRSLYLLIDNGFRLGTRVDHRARYPTQYLSHRERAAYSIRYDRRRARRRRRRERQRDRHLAAYRARMGMPPAG
jgi:hypothetical protein